MSDHSSTKILLKNALIINRGHTMEGDILIKDKRIERVGKDISDANAEIVDVNGKWVMPGIIDDQVHFRQPGYTHKACLLYTSPSPRDRG